MDVNLLEEWRKFSLTEDEALVFYGLRVKLPIGEVDYG